MMILFNYFNVSSITYLKINDALGYRSVNRDLETQIAIVTKNKKLQDALYEEQAQLFSCAKPATRKTFLQQDRVPPAWVCAVVLFFRYYF